MKKQQVNQVDKSELAEVIELDETPQLATEAEKKDYEHKHAQMKFEAFEHRAIAMAAMKKLKKWYDGQGYDPKNNIFQILFNQDLFDSESMTFTFPESNKKLCLSAGEITALAGDFFADENNPICEGKMDKANDTPIKRFQKAYNLLAQLQDDEDIQMIAELKEEIEKEYNIVVKGVLQNGLPSDVFKKFESDEEAAGRDRTFLYNSILMQHSLFSTTRLTGASGKYIQLLRYNFDHFSDDAKIAFKAGFESAAQQFKEAAEAKTESDKAILLCKAITQILFACHFLTDLFAGGHIRTPRKALHDQVRRKSSRWRFDAQNDYVSGMLSHEMHDEDNEGVFVKSAKHPTGWRALGDKCYYNQGNKENRKYAIEAMFEALKELIEIYHSSNEAELKYHYLQCIPEIDKENTNNHKPMFKIKKNTNPPVVTLRGDLATPPSDKRVEEWDAQAAWDKLKNKKHEHVFTKLPNEVSKRIWENMFDDMSWQANEASTSESVAEDEKSVVRKNS